MSVEALARATIVRRRFTSSRKLACADRALEREREVVDLERLRDEVVRARADRADGGLEAAERRHHDDRQVGPVRDDAAGRARGRSSPCIEHLLMLLDL
jgi:hypothetical protein